MRWTSTNLWIYRAGSCAMSLRSSRGTRELLRALRAAAAAPRPDGPLLLLANGRVGDALLAAAFTRRYRAWFGDVVAFARPETAPVLAAQLDHCVPFGPAHATALAEVAGRGCRAALGDLHLFHGGAALARAAAALDLPLLAYDGWIARRLQAPFRRWPRRTTVVPPFAKDGAGAGPERLHIWHDLLHHHRAALQHFGVAAALPDRPELPWQPDPGIGARLGLPRGYVACHAHSSQPKKDWPFDRFAAVFAACPDVPFALLGGAGAPALPPRPNVVDLRGRTDVRQAIDVAATARAFVGIDSGLAHAAAIARVPTVVAMPQATTGYFFPYPRAFGAHVVTVQSPAHAVCSGCGGICVHEPIWRSRRIGFPCLRAVAADDVVAALRRALA